MASSGTKTFVRTVQYWQLVDGRDSKPVQSIDWYHDTASWTGDLREDVGDETLTGSLHTVNLSNGESLRGIVLSSEKDYLPNEREAGTGLQKAMNLSGAQWSPVDNLFVVFLPFGNLIAVLAESVSSVRAGKFATWLDLRVDPSQKEEFYWEAQPVIDEDRADLLSTASGLKMLTIRAPYGMATAKEPSFIDAVRGVPDGIRGWEVEITIKATSKESNHNDRVELLKYFDETLGGLNGAESKAVLTTAGDDERGPTEIDLLHHRVTRKTKVDVQYTGEKHAVIGVDPVMQAIAAAYLEDRADLERIFGSEED